MKWLYFSLMWLTCNGALLCYGGNIDLDDIMRTIAQMERTELPDTTAAIINDINAINNENIIERQLDAGQAVDLYNFCYSHSQRLSQCAKYHRREVAVNLVYHDMTMIWLPMLQEDIPEVANMIRLDAGKGALYQFPRTNSARFVYYKWFQWTQIIISDMIAATNEPLLDLRKHRIDQSENIMYDIDLKSIWQQYRDIYIHYNNILRVYGEWRYQTSELQRKFMTVGLPTEQQRDALFPRRMEHHGLQANTKSLLDVLYRFYPHWCDDESNQVPLLKSLQLANRDLRVPILLFQHGIGPISYRDPKIGPILRRFNECQPENENYISSLIGQCQENVTLNRICLTVAYYQFPKILEKLLGVDVQSMMAPYTTLVNQVRRFEDSGSVREWNRRLQGLYKDLSHYFPMSNKVAELEEWYNVALPMTTPVTALYDFYHQKAKYVWIQCFEYLINDFAFWRQELTKAATIISIYQKKRKGNASFDANNCGADQSLYSCIASLHTFVYANKIDKLTMNKHYNLYGDINTLNTDILSLVGNAVVLTGHKQYRTTHIVELAPAVKKTKQLPVPVSTWSSDEFSGNEEPKNRMPKIQRSITSAATNPRKIYKAIGRAFSEK